MPGLKHAKKCLHGKFYSTQSQQVHEGLPDNSMVLPTYVLEPLTLNLLATYLPQLHMKKQTLINDLVRTSFYAV